MRMAFGRFGAMAVVLATGLASVASAASLAHDYELNGSLADSLSGPSLVSDGGTIGANVYTFGADQGLNLSNALTNAGDYSIETRFEFDTLSGFRKIIDFKNLASDNGLYDLSTALNYFNFTTGPNGAFSAGQFADLVLTRDSATNQVTGYVNGVEQITFTDSTSDAVFSGPNNIMHFFEDDNVTGSRESSAGSVDFIKIYDGALSAQDVAGLSVPLPKSVWGGAVLLAMLMLGRWMKPATARA
jgi:hypothetical protein